MPALSSGFFLEKEMTAGEGNCFQKRGSCPVLLSVCRRGICCSYGALQHFGQKLLFFFWDSRGGEEVGCE